MAKFLISTTGTQDPVTLSDLGYRSFFHPTVAYDLLPEFSISELGSSISLQTAFDSGYITATDEFGTPITSSRFIHIATISGGTNMSTGGTYNRFSVRLNDSITVSSISATTLSATIFSATTIYVGTTQLTSTGTTSFSALTTTILSAFTLSAGTIYSGSTELGAVIQRFIPTSAVVTTVQPGINITTGGTVSAPTINLVSSPFVNNITVSGTGFYNSFSGASVSGGTIYSGSTDLGSVIQRFISIDQNDITRVQPGSNITTGGTVNFPTINLVASPSVNSFTVSGTVLANTFSANTVSGLTFYSASTDLGTVIQRFISPDQNDITRVQPGNNIQTGGTANFPIVSTIDSPQFNNLNSSGTTSGINLRFQTISGGTLSGGTIYSASTELGVIIQRFISPDTNDITRVQPGSNITTGGTDNFPIINLTTNIAVNNITSSGTSLLNIFSATTISGGTFYSGSTELGVIIQRFADGNDVTRVQPGSNITTGGTNNFPSVNLVASPFVNNITVSGTGFYNSFSATSVSGGTIYSGSTDVGTLFALQGTQTKVGQGSNITTGGTVNNPIINIVPSPSFNDITLSGTGMAASYSATTLSGGTIFSGSTELGVVIQRFADGNDITRVQPGTNIITGGTGTSPIVNLVDSPFVNNLNMSGTGTFNTTNSATFSGTSGVFTNVSANSILSNSFSGTTGAFTTGWIGTGNIATITGTTGNITNVRSTKIESATFSGTSITATTVTGTSVYGGTLFSGSTELGVVIQRFISVDQNDITRVQPGTNISTGGTVNFPSVNLVDSPFVNNLNMSGTGTFNTTNSSIFSGTTANIATIGSNVHNSATISGTTGVFTNVSSNSTLSNTVSGTSGSFTTLWSTTTNLASASGTTGAFTTEWVGTGNIATITGTTSNITNVRAGTIISSSFSGTSLTATTVTGTSVYGGTLYSGSTELGVVISRFISPDQNDITRVQPGTNITTGGTDNFPSVNLVANPFVNNLNMSGTGTFNTINSSVLSGTTANITTIGSNANNSAIFSGTTGVLTNISSNSTLSNTLSGTSGSFTTLFSTTANIATITGTTGAFTTEWIGTGNISTITGTTANITNVRAGTITSNSFSGTSLTATTITGTSVFGGTIYSGSTELGVIIQRFADGNDITRVQPGTNISTGGTVNFPSVNLVDSPFVNNLNMSGTGTFNINNSSVFSGTTANVTTISSNTHNSAIFSGTTGVFTNATIGTVTAATITGTTANVTNVSSNSILSNTFSGTNGSFTTLWTTTANLSTATGTTAVFTNTIIGTDTSSIFTGTTGNITNVRSTKIESATFSGTSLTATTVTGTSVYGGTLFSGSTELGVVMARFAGTTTGGVTNIGQGSNITTGGTAAFPIINVSSSVQIPTVSGTSGAFTTEWIGTGNIATITGTTANITTIGSNANNSATFSGTTGVLTNVSSNSILSNTLSGTSGSFTTLWSTTGNIASISGTTGSLNTLFSTTGNIATITGTTANITTIGSNVHNSATFSGTTGVLTNISSNSILSNTFSGTSGSFTTLFSTTSNIATLTGTTANITTVNAGTVNSATVTGTTANFTNIRSGTITSSSFSGTSLTATTVTGTSVFGGTLFSGSTELGVVMARFAGTSGGGAVNFVGQGLNITTGGTATFPIINLADNVKTPSVSGTTGAFTTEWIGTGNIAAITGTTANITTVSGGTIISGATDLSLLFHKFIPYTVYTSGNSVNSTQTKTDVSQLTLPVAANEKCKFTFDLFFDAAATTTALGLSVSTPASPVQFTASFQIALNGNNILQSGTTAPDGGILGTNSPGSGERSPARVYGMLINGPNAGNIQLRSFSEVNASSVTIYSGSTGTKFIIS